MCETLIDSVLLAFRRLDDDGAAWRLNDVRRLSAACVQLNVVFLPYVSSHIIPTDM